MIKTKSKREVGKTFYYLILQINFLKKLNNIFTKRGFIRTHTDGVKKMEIFFVIGFNLTFFIYVSL